MDMVRERIFESYPTQKWNSAGPAKRREMITTCWQILTAATTSLQSFDEAFFDISRLDIDETTKALKMVDLSDALLGTIGVCIRYYRVNYFPAKFVLKRFIKKNPQWVGSKIIPAQQISSFSIIDKTNWGLDAGWSFIRPLVVSIMLKMNQQSVGIEDDDLHAILSSINEFVAMNG